MYNVKIQLVCIFLCFAGIVYSQDTTKTKVSEEEKTRIKQNFKDDAFYINDDGVVVYTRKNSKADSTKTTALVQSTTTPTTEKVIIKENNLVNDNLLSNNNYKVTPLPVNNSDDSTLDSSFLSTGDTTIESTPVEPTQQFITKKKDDISSEVREEISKIEKSIPDVPEVQRGYTVKKEKTSNITDEDLEIISKPQSGSAYIIKEERELINKSSVEQALQEKVKEETYSQPLEDEEIDTTPLSKKKTTFNSLEEANLAVDQLIAQLKREQKQINKSESKSNSLSSRVVNGYRPNPNKKESTKKEEASDYDLNESADGVNGDFGTDPTYYINGVVVDKAEVLKLRNKNILSRTIKVRNTASGNPNGEIWLEVKNYQ